MKPVQKIFPDAKGLEIVTLTTLIVTFASYAMLTAYFHGHADFGIHSDCPICGIAEALSSTDKTITCAMAIRHLQYILTDSEGFFRIPAMVIAATSTRAPPVIAPQEGLGDYVLYTRRFSRGLNQLIRPLRK
jgi:hypothetical protein